MGLDIYGIEQARVIGRLEHNRQCAVFGSRHHQRDQYRFAVARHTGCHINQLTAASNVMTSQVQNLQVLPQITGPWAHIEKCVTIGDIPSSQGTTEVIDVEWRKNADETPSIFFLHKPSRKDTRPAPTARGKGLHGFRMPA